MDTLPKENLPTEGDYNNNDQGYPRLEWILRSYEDYRKSYETLRRTRNPTNDSENHPRLHDLQQSEDFKAQTLRKATTTTNARSTMEIGITRLHREATDIKRTRNRNEIR